MNSLAAGWPAIRVRFRTSVNWTAQSDTDSCLPPYFTSLDSRMPSLKAKHSLNGSLIAALEHRANGGVERFVSCFSHSPLTLAAARLLKVHHLLSLRS